MALRPHNYSEPPWIFLIRGRKASIPVPSGTQATCSTCSQSQSWNVLSSCHVIKKVFPISLEVAAPGATGVSPVPSSPIDFPTSYRSNKEPCRQSVDRRQVRIHILGIRCVPAGTRPLPIDRLLTDSAGCHWRLASAELSKRPPDHGWLTQKTLSAARGSSASPNRSPDRPMRTSGHSTTSNRSASHRFRVGPGSRGCSRSRRGQSFPY